MKAKYCHCKRDFSIAHGGESDVKQHASTALHKIRLVQSSECNIITSFFAKEGTSEEHTVTASELAS
jgi:hypothetical protein